MKWKAQCATNILKQLVRCRERRRRDGAAHASSQGQAPAPVPSLIMAADLNCTKQALKAEMGVIYFDGLPRIKGADKQHEVGCYDISVARPPEFPTPEDRTRVDDKVQEPGKKVLADTRSAREAALAATQGQEEEEAKPEEPQSQDGDSAAASANERRAEGRRSSAKELYERSMRSYRKTTVFSARGKSRSSASMRAR